MTETPLTTSFVRPCARCAAPATWIPVLRLLPSVLHGPSKPILAQMWEPVCDLHREQVTVKQLVTETFYANVEKVCMNNGWPWPERTLTQIRFIPYGSSSLAEKKDRERAEAN